LLIVFTLGLTVNAQQSDVKKDAAAAAETTAQKTLPSPLANDQELIRRQVQEAIINSSAGLNQIFVVKDGAVYLTIPASEVLLPMPGGGASGCFGLDLPQRIERLRAYIKSIPLGPDK